MTSSFATLPHSSASRSLPFSPRKHRLASSAMAQQQQDAIDTFIAVTGASEADALRLLEDHGGNLNEAVDAYYNGGDRTEIRQNAPLPHLGDDRNLMETDNPLEHTVGSSLLSGRGYNQFSLLDSTIRREFLEGLGDNIFSRAPRVTHPRIVREIPIEVKDSHPTSGSSSHGPTIVDITGDDLPYGPGIQGTVTIDDDDEDDDENALGSNTNLCGNDQIPDNSTPSVPLVDIGSDDEGVEEQIIQAVMEASKREVGGDISDDLVAHHHEHRHAFATEDNELAQATSRPMEVEIAEQFGVSKKLDMDRKSAMNRRRGLAFGKEGTSTPEVDAGSFNDHVESEDIVHQSLVSRHSRSIASRRAESIESAKPSISPASSPWQNSANNGFQSDEWGGLSSEEHVDAVMLEAAMFGGVPEGTTYRFALPQNFTSDNHSTQFNRVSHPASPSLTEQRLLWEQQDDEYTAALQADREKELKALEEAEQRRLVEAAAREAAVEKQKIEEEERLRKQKEEQELELELEAKKARLPQEPLPDNENAITINVRMPDGSRYGRRFLKSDKLQFLYDYLESERIVKPRTYILVRPFPRKAFIEEEIEQPLGNLGLTSKLEALFLELI